jgi:hypothetical protein
LQARWRCLELIDDHRCSDIPEYARIQDLLITTCTRQRDKDGGQANICQLGDRSRAGSPDDEIGSSVDVRELVSKELNHRVATANGFGERFSQPREVARVRVRVERTGLVDDLRVIENAGEQRGNPLVDWARASRTAGDIDNWKSGVEPKVSQTARAVAGRQPGSYGIAGYHDVTVKPSRQRFCLAVRNGEDVGESRVDAVGQPNDGGLLVRQHRGDPACGDDSRDADKTAGAENDVWAEGGKGSPSGQHTEGNTRGVGKISNRKVPTELSGGYGGELDAGLYSRSMLDAVPASDPHQIRQGSASPQIVDDR